MPIVEFSSIPAQEKMVNVHIHYMLNCKIVHVYADLGIVVGGGGGAAWKSRHTTAAWKKSCVDPEGGGGTGGSATLENNKLYAWVQRGADRGVRPPPPGKSQVIWGSIGNKQVDPSLKKLDPPPWPGKVEPPPKPWKLIFFFEINHLISVK